MKKFDLCAAFLIALFLITGGRHAGAASSQNDIVRKVRPATVMIIVYDRTGNPVVQGSGFLFRSYGHVITNYHVLGRATMAKARTFDGREFNIKSIVAENADDDLIEAIVDVSSGTMPFLMPAGTVPKRGDSVMVIGSPLGVDKVVSQGTVHSIQEIAKYGKCIVHSAHSFHGSSGSPLVNDQGEVIGIESAGVEGRPDVSFAIPLERFSRMLPNFRELQATTSARATVETTSRQENAQSGVLQKDIQMAESGDPMAQVRLGMRYEQGKDLPANCFEALNLYRKAANQGNLQAEFHVGRMYYSGKCSGQNLGEAARWLRTAAEHGFADAQRMYGTMYYNGEGVRQDRVAACMWMFLAASQGNAEANKLLRLMSSELTPGEYNTAKEKAKDWKPEM